MTIAHSGAAPSGDDGASLWLVLAGVLFWLVLGAGFLIFLVASVFLVISGVRELLVHAGVIYGDVSAPWPLVAVLTAVFASFPATIAWLLIKASRQG